MPLGNAMQRYGDSLVGACSARTMVFGDIKVLITGFDRGARPLSRLYWP
jgi:hypothetical protein